MGPTPPNNGTMQNSTTSANNTNRAICRYYKTKSCKHGDKGTNCKLRHPPTCLKFLKHGDKLNRGSMKGTDCNRYHPKLCFDSQNQEWYDNESCRLHHLPGTEWSPPQQPHVGSTTPASYARVAQRSYLPGTEWSLPQQPYVRLTTPASYTRVAQRSHLPAPEWSPPQQPHVGLTTSASYTRVAQRSRGSAREEESRQCNIDSTQNLNTEAPLHGNVGSLTQLNFQDIVVQIQQMQRQLAKILQNECSPPTPRVRSGVAAIAAPLIRGSCGGAHNDHRKHPRPLSSEVQAQGRLTQRNGCRN